MPTCGLFACSNKQFVRYVYEYELEVWECVCVYQYVIWDIHNFKKNMIGAKNEKQDKSAGADAPFAPM